MTQRDNLYWAYADTSRRGIIIRRCEGEPSAGELREAANGAADSVEARTDPGESAGPPLSDSARRIREVDDVARDASRALKLARIVRDCECTAIKRCCHTNRAGRGV